MKESFADNDIDYRGERFTQDKGNIRFDVSIFKKTSNIGAIYTELTTDSLYLMLFPLFLSKVNII